MKSNILVLHCVFFGLAALLGKILPGIPILLTELKSVINNEAGEQRLYGSMGLSLIENHGSGRSFTMDS
jgi:hypothetical protein